MGRRLGPVRHMTQHLHSTTVREPVEERTLPMTLSMSRCERDDDASVAIGKALALHDATERSQKLGHLGHEAVLRHNLDSNHL